MCFLLIFTTLSSHAEKGDVKTRTALINHIIDDSKENAQNKDDSGKSNNQNENINIESLTIAQKITNNELTNKANLITLNFKDADLRNILRMIARSVQANIIAGPEVKGTVTMELNKVGWEQALSLVLSVNGYTYLKEGNIIRVVSTDRIDKEPLNVAVIPLNYAKSDEIVPIIKPMLTPERGKIESDTRANVIIINDIPTKISQVREIIKGLDQPTPQVLIEVNFVEIALGKTDTIGVDWSNMSDYGVLLHDVMYTFDKETTRNKTKSSAEGTTAAKADATRDSTLSANSASAYQLSPDNFRLAFSLLANNQRAKVISNPKIQTLDNRKATIRVAETHYKPTFTYNKETGAYEINNLEDVYVGITLEVTPHISKNGYVTLDIKPTVSALAGNQIIQGVEVPIVNERMIDARVALKDTYTVAIGGMIKDDWVTSRNSIPYFGDLPYVGKSLFGWDKKEKKKDNLIIFITASIVKPEENNPSWNKQLREMHMKQDGQFEDVITNYPSWHRLALSEDEIQEREQALIIDASTNSVGVDSVNINKTE
ncbi:MAG: hypothetical protein DRI44_09575 [Chlamydiae bacterium]|nr:MAG: hypothetical protein DRI44_09575 [Chlamydiota bacterium]